MKNPHSCPSPWPYWEWWKRPRHDESQPETHCYLHDNPVAAWIPYSAVRADDGTYFVVTGERADVGEVVAEDFPTLLAAQKFIEVLVRLDEI